MMRWMKRIGIGIAVIALLAVAGFYMFQRQIGEALFERAIAERIGRDPAAELEDGLHVYMCGTGSPMADHQRAGPCIGVVAGEHVFLFDAGSGSMRTAGRMGFPVTRTERLFLTHIHSDHFDGMGELMVQAWAGGGRDEPLPVWGPPGTAETAQGFNAAYRIDSGYRTAHHGTGVANPAGYGFAPREIRLPEGAGSTVVYRRDGVTITAFSVTHDPVENPLGYRIDYRGRSIAISGDTAYDPNLAAASVGVDILFHEALDPEMVGTMERTAENRGADVIAKILSDIPSYHASPEEAARAAQEAGAGTLVFYHIIPPLPSRLLHAYFLGDADEHFDGSIRLAEDGQLISLPANSEAIEYRSVLR